jgi:hypothetical protein
MIGYVYMLIFVGGFIFGALYNEWDNSKRGRNR